MSDSSVNRTDTLDAVLREMSIQRTNGKQLDVLGTLAFPRYADDETTKRAISTAVNRLNENAALGCLLHGIEVMRGLDMLHRPHRSINVLLDGLTSAGLSVTATDPQGNTAIHYACVGNHYQGEREEFTSALLARGFPVDVRDHANMTPLAILASNSTLLSTTVMHLVEHGADVNARDSLDNTVLHHAFRRLNTEMQSQQTNLSDVQLIQFLVANGADLTLKGHKNYTPIEVVENLYSNEGDQELNAFLQGIAENDGDSPSWSR